MYSGTGGVPISSLWRRLLFAIRFATTDILVTRTITPEAASSSPADRRPGRTLAPFLSYDADPYPVAEQRAAVLDPGRVHDDGELSVLRRRRRQWGDVNYIRNSVKVVIDAYNGTTTLLPGRAERSDRRTTIGEFFPACCSRWRDMPAGLRQHVRYPEDIFKIQAAMFATYHMTNPPVFYTKEDQWQVPVLDSAPEPGADAAVLHDHEAAGRDSEAEFIQMLPFTPRRKDNLAAWMVARSDGDALRPAARVPVSRSRRSCSGRGRSSAASTRIR